MPVSGARSLAPTGSSGCPCSLTVAAHIHKGLARHVTPHQSASTLTLCSLGVSCPAPSPSFSSNTDSSTAIWKLRSSASALASSSNSSSNSRNSCRLTRARSVPFTAILTNPPPLVARMQRAFSSHNNRLRHPWTSARNTRTGNENDDSASNAKNVDAGRECARVNGTCSTPSTLDHSHLQERSHPHSLFGHSHSPNERAARSSPIVRAIEGGNGGDRGSRITIIGLISNVGLTASKGIAGWYMNSAALLAEAGHSASDLLGDFVTLFAWRISRKPPTPRYPYGFGKFETLGTTTLALILVAGAFGIGMHSIALLAHQLGETAAALPAGPAQELVQNVTAIAESLSSHAPSHVHSHGLSSRGTLDPNAAWFAGASIIIKEWLYRATSKIAKEEKSNVLFANAMHHRADAYTSAVALAAILGTWAFPALPLDPLGGLLVALVIFKQGLALSAEAFLELTDAGVRPQTYHALREALRPLEQKTYLPSASTETGRVYAEQQLFTVEITRAMRSGTSLFVDVRVRVPHTLCIGKASQLEDRICESLRKSGYEIARISVKFVPVYADDTAKEDSVSAKQQELQQ